MDDGSGSLPADATKAPAKPERKAARLAGQGVRGRCGADGKLGRSFTSCCDL